MTPSNRNKILVVDDEPILRLALSADLKRRGFDVLLAENGRDAYEIVRKENVDLILSDVRMPGGDGIELLDRIKDFDTRKPVVFFVTGFSDMSLEEAYHRGAEAVFNKPFDRQVLFDSVLQATSPRNEAWSKNHNNPGPDQPLEKLEARFSCLESAAERNKLGLARGGMFVESNLPFLPLASHVRFKISFDDPSTPELSGVGVVRWSKQSEADPTSTISGIEFLYLNEPCRSFVVEYFDKRKERAFIPSPEKLRA